jgi:hypothetical protein
MLRIVGPDVAAQIYADPLIRSFSQPVMTGEKLGRDRPSYIPSRTFAVALLGRLGLAEGTRPTIDAVRAALKDETKANPQTREILTRLVDDSRDILADLRAQNIAKDEMEIFKQTVEIWFNSAMERVSGWYKRRTQLVLLLVGAIVTMAANADTLYFIKVLWRDPAVRNAMLAQARGIAADPNLAKSLAEETGPPRPPTRLPDDNDPNNLAEARYESAVSQLESLPLPIGWQMPQPGDSDPEYLTWPGSLGDEQGRARWGGTFRYHFIGWTLTMLALSLGAPFWFDVLNKAISIRSAGKAPEEHPQDPRLARLAR